MADRSLLVDTNMLLIETTHLESSLKEAHLVFFKKTDRSGFSRFSRVLRTGTYVCTGIGDLRRCDAFFGLALLALHACSQHSQNYYWCRRVEEFG